MEKQRRINTIVVCGLMIIIGTMTIGFAALSQILDINGTATIKNATTSWNIYFSSVNTTGGLTGTGTWATAPSVSTDSSNSGSNNKIAFACDLAAPGDSCTVTAAITNGGTTSAKYTGYTFSVDGKAQSGTTVTLDSGAVITITPATSWEANTTVLKQNDTGNFIIKMELPTSVTSLPDEETSHKFEMSINFEQSQ